MVKKVLNEGFTIHKVFGERKEIHPRSGKEILKKIFSKDYVFQPGEIVEVTNEDFAKMVDDDFMRGRIYTKKQYEERTKLIERQDALKEKLLKARSLEAQEEIREEMTLSEEERYLIMNNLPHEV